MTGPIVRSTVTGVPGVLITMSDGLSFHLMNDASDAEIEREAAEVREFLAVCSGDEPDYDEDPDADGYGWERAALRGVA